DSVTVQRMDGDDRRLVGRWHQVPWASTTEQLVDILREQDGTEIAVEVKLADTRISRSRNLAGEPRDVVEIDLSVGADRITVVPAGSTRRLQLRGALSRAAMMTGAMQGCVSLASDYSKVRQQFGRPIGHFQAVQHLLAVAAENSALADAAVTVAA